MAQLWIRNLTISPSVVTTSNNIQVIADNRLPSYPCPLVSSSVTISGFNINVYCTHNTGIAQAICSATDIVNVGTLQPGPYCLAFHLIRANPVQTVTIEVDTICFTVEQVAGLTDYSLTNKYFSIYPNPTNSKFNIGRPKDVLIPFDVDIFNLYGQELSSIKQANTETPIDISNLPNGTYILAITDHNITQRLKIIKGLP